MATANEDDVRMIQGYVLAMASLAAERKEIAKKNGDEMRQERQKGAGWAARAIWSRINFGKGKGWNAELILQDAEGLANKHLHRVEKMEEGHIERGVKHALESILDYLNLCLHRPPRSWE